MQNSIVGSPLNMKNISYGDIFHIRCSFSFLDIFLITYSRFFASLSVSNASLYMSTTGILPRVYFAHFLLL